MRSLLIVLSVLEIALVVGALAFYLVRIARSLRASSANLAKVTFGVRAIETQCASIGPSVVKVNGQLATIAGALGKYNISIESMIQTGRSGDYVPIVIITHEAAERDIQAALAEIDGFDMIRESSKLIRIEDNLE